MEDIMKEKEIERLNNLKAEELKLYERNIEYICGIDEAGRGPLAGPVVVGAVILPQDSFIEGVNDSKKISEKKRERIYDQIIEEAIAWSVGIVDEKTIDEINILNATKLGVKLALEGLKQKPDVIMVDALNNMDTLGIPYISVVKGDAKNYSIAAASIIAKVTRDRMMQEWDEVYPAYGFAKHKGYGTAEHIRVIKENGPCSIHRRSFIKNFVK
ncbi:MAG: ribonuclease HII [Clostridia bacterium]|nr:ribonuclease HII [Clostridia bacterium]